MSTVGNNSYVLWACRSGT